MNIVLSSPSRASHGALPGLRSFEAVSRLFSLLLRENIEDAYHILSAVSNQTRHGFLSQFLQSLSSDLLSRGHKCFSEDEILLYFSRLTKLSPNFALSVLFHLFSFEKSVHFSFCHRVFLRVKDFCDSDSPYYLRISALLCYRSDLGLALDFLARVSESGRDYDYWVDYGRWCFLYSYHFSGSLRESFISRSLECYDRALLLRPNDAHVLSLLGIVEQRRGNMARGFLLFEHRHRSLQRSFPKPLWDGSSFPGQVLFVHHEWSGFGDAIQFARYLKDLYDRFQPGGGVLFLTYRQLERLFRECFDLGGIQLHFEDEDVPFYDYELPYDYILPLPSLFSKCDPTLSRMGINRPYICASPRRIEGGGDNRKIGLIWASTSGDNTRNKTIPLDVLARLNKARGVHFYSLQYEADLNLAVRSRSDLSFIDTSLHPESMDFYDLACAISGLDGIISVDTAGAHLSGAMFCPLLVLVPYRNRCWRWNEDTYEADWYPSAVRLYQDVSADWGVVLDEVVDRLNNGSFPGHLSSLRLRYI